MKLDTLIFDFTSKQKKCKVTFTVTEKLAENNTVYCIVTNLSGECKVKFDYKFDNSSDFENFSNNLIQGLCPQFWLHVAKMYRLEIDNLALDVERRYHYFQHDAETEHKNTKFSTYFNSKKDRFFLSLKNSNNMKLIADQIINVLS